MKRSPNTVSYEIRKNKTQGIYDPKKAQHKAYVRRHKASFRSQKIIRTTKLRKFIEGTLSDGQSPEAISGRIKYVEKHLPNVSKNTIYDFLDSPYGTLIKEKRKKKKRHFRKSRKVALSDRRFIEKRPMEAEKRMRVGHVEADFIISGRGGSGILLVVCDRKIRTTFLEVIPNVSIDAVHKAFQKIKKRYPEIRTLTLDNDILFNMHKTLEKLLDIRIYFCHPYHSWEKGSVENVNKYIRTFIPKGSDISKVDHLFVSAIEDKCNGRFLKCLKYKTPEEKLKEHRLRKQKRRLSVY